MCNHAQKNVQTGAGLSMDGSKEIHTCLQQKKLLLEIEKVKPDVVVMDLGLYVKIDGIETSRMIRSRFDVPVMYV